MTSLAALSPSASPLERLEHEIARYSDMIVAFSGGVDSSVLLAAARRVLGERVLALTADSPSMARHELAVASSIAAKLGARHLIVATDEMENPDYVMNDSRRCYFCKKSLFTVSDEVARLEGFSTIAYGYTADDVGDFRPGHLAAQEHRIVAPLLDASLGKDDIRRIARQLGLEVWDKPASPCLSSRIPHGSAVTREKLIIIESVEASLRELGFRIFRARFDGAVMRIEIGAAELGRALEPVTRESILTLARNHGALTAGIDPLPFRSGSLSLTGLPA